MDLVDRSGYTMRVKHGHSNAVYLVFYDETDADDYNEWLFSEVGERLNCACFGGFFNALVLDDGMGV